MFSFVPSEGRTQCLLRQVIQIYGTITPLHINNEITTQHRVHTSRNTAKKYRGVGLYTLTVGWNGIPKQIVKGMGDAFDQILCDNFIFLSL